jgi:hypothetical protein
MFIFCLYIIFQITTSNVLLVVAIKPKAKYRFNASACVFIFYKELPGASVAPLSRVRASAVLLPMQKIKKQVTMVSNYRKCMLNFVKTDQFTEKLKELHTDSIVITSAFLFSFN